MEKYIFIIGIILMFLVGCDNDVTVNTYQKYENSEKYAVGNFEVEEIKKIKIDWIYGTVNIEKSNNNKLIVTEEIDNEKQEYQMHYLINDGNLDIKFMESNCVMPIKNLKKNLLIKIPSNVQDLDITVISAKVELNNFSTQNLEINSVSGEVEVKNLYIEAVSIDAVSGKISVSKVEANEIEVGSTSGEILMNDIKSNTIDISNVSGKNSLDNCSINTSLEIESTSGSIKVVLIKCPININLSTVSGSINLQTPTLNDYFLKVKTIKGTTKEEKGNKLYNITLESTSGKITYKLD